ncbi:lytic transglycosylase domain-containing protein [bacterium]|nr:lytic transglycosylase domain-containing protein [bacterium]
MKKNYIAILKLLSGMYLLAGCAGPISPFGGLEVWSGDGQSFVFSSKEIPSSEFSLRPKRQVLHKASDFKIEFNLNNQKKTNPRIKVTYNNKDVTNTFLKAAKLNQSSQKQIEYVFNKLRLKPDRRHSIDVYWSPNDDNVFSRLAYLPPVCSISATRSIASTEPFKPNPEYIKSIKNTATTYHINPSLLAGLVAQESGFNPAQVSTAKAIGLTQITPIADDEIKKVKPEWRSDPRIEKLSVTEIENLIRRQEISRQQDWRLDPQLAIEGGALYLNYLMNYWSVEENKALLNSTPHADRTGVILASYNSGAARVKSKIKSNGEYWLEDDELKEAFKYVNSVVSYCYHFSDQ